MEDRPEARGPAVLASASGLLAARVLVAAALCLVSCSASPRRRAPRPREAGGPSPAGAAASSPAPEVKPPAGPSAEPGPRADEPGPRIPAGWSVTKGAGEFDRHGIEPPEAADAVRREGKLAVPGKCVSGWVEYDFDVPGAGWCEILVSPECFSEVVVDGKLSLFGRGGRKLEENGEDGKIDNVWLTEGRHTVRIQRYIWWGFWPAMTGLTIRRADAGLAGTVRIEYAHGPGDAILRKGDELRLTVVSADRPARATLEAHLKDRATGRTEATARVALPQGRALRRIPVALPCRTEGVYRVEFSEGDTPLGERDLRSCQVHVLDATPVARPGGEIRKALVQEVACVARPPDYVSGGETRVVTGPAGRYRESGDVGFLFSQHHGTESSWFAYAMAVEDVGVPHVLEVDYPDDGFRTFMIAVRERSPEAYPVASGVDSGECWSLTNRMLTHSILFWPRSRDPRVLLMTPHNGRRAAAARIRLYRVDGEIEPLDVPASGGRSFVNWYEEGSNFVGFYGGSKQGFESLLPAADMWPRATSHMGVDMLIPTVSVYQMSLFPSRYNDSFAEMTSPDVVRVLLLECERYGMRLAGEFHPEARDLDRLGRAPGGRVNGLVSKDGKVSTFETGGPRHHPLHPVNREWYLGMVGEFADRYADSPALAGVSLRLMSWANPSLNNFHSLDWGYGDLTIGLFEKETGTKVPVPAGAADRFSRRHAWLMENARREWIDWRCGKVAGVYRDLVARVRRARADLKVYSTVFDLGPEAGIDPARLSRIDGLVLVNCLHSYGRRDYTYRGPMADQVMRDNLLDPGVLSSLRGRSGGAFIFGAGYFEATERVAPPERLGFPADTKKTWMSGVANPAGRHFLERYALALAEADAQVLGDGGNAYTLGPPLLREFMIEYRRLPAIPFRPRKDARDPVAVWELERDDAFLFYAVNRERFGVEIRLRVESRGPVKRLATGREVPVEGGVLKVALEPYQLLAFTAPEGASIRRVETTVPVANLAVVASQVTFLRELAADVEAGRLDLAEGGRRLLRDAAAEAALCLREGRVWRARTLAEHHSLATEVYQKVGRYPPGLDYLDGLPAEKRIAPRDPGRPDVLASLDRIEGGRTPLDTKFPLEAVCEGGATLVKGVRGSALSLDGVTGRVVIRGEGLVKLGLDRFTVSAWIRPRTVGGRRGIAHRLAWPRGWGLLLWNGSVSLEVASKGAETTCRTPDGLFAAGEWQHVAATVEAGKEIVLYKDGFEVKRAALKHGIEETGEPLVVGRDRWGGRQNDPSPGFFQGEIDEFRIWRRALTREEIVGDWKSR